MSSDKLTIQYMCRNLPGKSWRTCRSVHVGIGRGATMEQITSADAEEIVLEVHAEATVRELGRQDPSWFTARRGLFSEEHHLCLREASWSEKHQVAMERHLVVALATGDVTQYVSTTQAYADSEYESVIAAQGFGQIERYGSLEGSDPNPSEDFFVLVGRARESV